MKNELWAVPSDIEILLSLGSQSEFPNKRDFAYSTMRNSHCGIVVFSPLFWKENKKTIIAIFRHELAHIIYNSEGDFEHSEQDADDLAEDIWGDRIYYDDDDIQTLNIGKYPRPEHLNKR
jgi:hypothetical protein